MNVFIGSSILLILLFLGGIVLDKAGCISRWENSGIESSYGVMKGCTIKTKQGLWIPETSYKQIAE